jgi:hypothetical protein
MTDWAEKQFEILGYPLVGIESNGGPFDDESWFAGFYCATFDFIMSHDDSPIERGLIPARAIQQLDLIAMRWGYKLIAGPTNQEGWRSVVLVRGSRNEDSAL